MEEWELRLEISKLPVDHLLIFNKFFGCGQGILLLPITTWVTHFPYLSYSQAGCGVPLPDSNRSLLVDNSSHSREETLTLIIFGLLCLCPNVGCLSPPRSGLTCTRSPRAGHWTSSRESWKCSASQHLIWRCVLFKVHCHRSSDEVKSALHPHKLQVSLPCMNVFL